MPRTTRVSKKSKKGRRTSTQRHQSSWDPQIAWQLLRRNKNYQSLVNQFIESGKTNRASPLVQAFQLVDDWIKTSATNSLPLGTLVSSSIAKAIKEQSDVVPLYRFLIGYWHIIKYPVDFNIDTPNPEALAILWNYFPVADLGQGFSRVAAAQFDFSLGETLSEIKRLSELEPDPRAFFAIGGALMESLNNRKGYRPRTHQSIATVQINLRFSPSHILDEFRTLIEAIHKGIAPAPHEDRSPKWGFVSDQNNLRIYDQFRDPFQTGKKLTLTEIVRDQERIQHNSKKPRFFGEADIKKLCFSIEKNIDIFNPVSSF